MPTPRFYCDLPLASGSRLPLPEALAHHARHVLRLPEGAAVTLFNGHGGEYPATLHAAGRGAEARLGAHLPREAELPGRITLVQGLPSGDKMDWIVEKAAELGAARIAPIAAQRSVLKLSGERAEKRAAHWRRIAQAASEQCGRNRLMEVGAPMTLQDWLAQNPAGPRLLCHPENARHTLAEALAPLRDQPASLTLLVGPEGGWSNEELAAAAKADISAVRFGPRVLRTETAGIALIAATTALLGW